MNYSPNLPTDNLYKFMAMCGLLLTIACIAYLAYMQFLLYKSEKEIHELTNYTLSLNAKREIDKRIKYLKEGGDVNSNRLKWLPKNFSKNEEIKFLITASQNNKEAIEHYENSPHDSLEKLRDLFATTRWYLYFFAALGPILLNLGFYRWYKHQLRRDKLDEMEIELKDMTIKKTKLEIKKLSKPNFIK